MGFLDEERIRIIPKVINLLSLEIVHNLAELILLLLCVTECNTLIMNNYFLVVCVFHCHTHISEKNGHYVWFNIKIGNFLVVLRPLVSNFQIFPKIGHTKIKILAELPIVTSH